MVGCMLDRFDSRGIARSDSLSGANTNEIVSLLPEFDSRFLRSAAVDAKGGGDILQLQASLKPDSEVKGIAQTTVASASAAIGSHAIVSPPPQENWQDGASGSSGTKQSTAGSQVSIRK